MPMITANNVNIYYEIHGQGEPLVLICGLAPDHVTWVSILDALAKKFQVIIFDNRGGGQSEVTEAPFTTELFADDTAALMQALKLKIEQAHVLVHYMGSTIAQQLALRYPKKVNRLILYGSYMKQPALTQLVVKNTRGMLLQDVPIPLIAECNLPWLYGSHFVSDPNKLAMALDRMINNPNPITPLGYQNQMLVCVSHDTTGELQNICSPTLIVVGENDLLTPPRYSRAIAEVVPNAELVVIHGVAHMLHIENPAEFNRVIMDFILKSTPVD